MYIFSYLYTCMYYGLREIKNSNIKKKLYSEKKSSIYTETYIFDTYIFGTDYNFMVCLFNWLIIGVIKCGQSRCSSCSSYFFHQTYNIIFLKRCWLYKRNKSNVLDFTDFPFNLIFVLWRYLKFSMLNGAWNAQTL